jgi:hypothetical protein
MRNRLLRRSTLLLVLLASVAGAKEREPNERNLYLSDHPSREAPDVYVVGGIVTVLRLEQPCDPARTSMLGWEGRFEPVECAGKSVLLVPLHDIEPEDRFILLVTLADGTELPCTVTSRQETLIDRTGDQQVNVFRDHKAPKPEGGLRGPCPRRTSDQRCREADAVSCAPGSDRGRHGRERPESKPGTAILEFSSAGVYIVNAFR